MFSDFPRELLFALLSFAIIGIFWRYKADRLHIRELQSRATQAFHAMKVESLDARYELKGETAIIERREETGGARGLLSNTADMAVTIYAQNIHGERFMFKWFSNSAHAPFVKHLPSTEQEGCKA